ncbi:MAG: tRNA adenosine(34) deaminase TadA [Syntrophomonadaceae bacterium]|jgi:tRNA(adenine34) deaminase|nr:tRNA adenosine(34) deaminase TadA [Syntrophomonadaceae bacterium]
MEHFFFMQEALREAEQAMAMGEVPIGALLVKDNRIIARGRNTKETEQDPTGHAEINVIKAGAKALQSWRFSGTTLYVTLEPCAMCAGAIVQARIPVLVYGASDPKAGAVDSVMNLVQHPRLNHQVHVLSGIMEEECRELMRRFFAELRG